MAFTNLEARVPRPSPVAVHDESNMARKRPSGQGTHNQPLDYMAHRFRNK